MTAKHRAPICRHHRRLEPPHHLRAGLLVVFDGVPGSGKTAQLSRIRASQRSEGLFASDPMFVELPRDLSSGGARERRAAAVASRASGRPVFTERWHPDDGLPDITMLSLVSFTDPAAGRLPPVDPGMNVVVTSPGFESVVTLQLFEALLRRGLMAACPCGLPR